MSNESEPLPPQKKIPRAKPVNDGFVVYEVDGFAQMTPEQKTWPVVNSFPQSPRKNIEAPPPEKEVP